MFAANSYFEVNREERHFAFLFASAIIYNHRFRAMVFDNYNDLNGTRLISEAGQFDIYMEVTALRDYWKEIDRRTTEPKADPSIVILEKSRIISKILESEKIDPEIIRKEDFFWTCKESANRKIWYPGHWNAKAIDESKTLNPAYCGILKQIRWAFNAKPDILIDSLDSALMIEVKLESGEGRSKNGYAQFPTQVKVAELMKLLIPRYIPTEFKHSFLSLKIIRDGPKSPCGLTWASILEFLNLTRHDQGTDYICKCMKMLVDRY